MGGLTPGLSSGEVARIDVLCVWQRGVLVGAVGVVALAAVRAINDFGCVVALVGALSAFAVIWTVRWRLLGRCALRDELAGIPVVARERARLCSPRKRRRLAAALRNTVTTDLRPLRAIIAVDPARVGLVRDELLAIACELECAAFVEPATMRELNRLVSNVAVSPLLNDGLPEAALVITVRQLRFRLATASTCADREDFESCH